MSEMTAVRLEKQGSIGLVWLSNPARRNAMGPEFFEQMPVVMDQVDRDPEIRAVVLLAEGPAFTVGLDLAKMNELFTPQGSQAEIRTKLHHDVFRLQKAINVVADCKVPTIAVLHGWCIGGGVDLCTACDIRLAASDLKLSVRETKMAIVADLGTLQRLPKIISKGHVAELVYTGKDITSARAKEIGLVNDVYESFDSAKSAAVAMAQEIAGNSPLVVKGAKNVLTYCEDKSTEAGLQYVAAWNSAFLLSDDLMEAMASFIEKRKPNYQGK